MDTTDVSSYRPISNLPVLSKLLERLVVRQLIDYLQSADLLRVNQSGFRPGHSIETAVLRVLSDILLAVDRGEVAALILLDLSANDYVPDSYGLAGTVEAGLWKFWSVFRPTFFSDFSR